MTNNVIPAPAPAADAHADAIQDEDGALFGLALGSLGFGPVRTVQANLGGIALVTEVDNVRVITYPEDGHRVVVIAFDPRYPVAQLENWRMEFGGHTPIDVVAGALAVALGKLAVR